METRDPMFNALTALKHLSVDDLVKAKLRVEEYAHNAKWKVMPVQERRAELMNVLPENVVKILANLKAALSAQEKMVDSGTPPDTALIANVVVLKEILTAVDAVSVSLLGKLHDLLQDNRQQYLIKSNQRYAELFNQREQIEKNALSRDVNFKAYRAGEQILQRSQQLDMGEESDQTRINKNRLEQLRPKIQSILDNIGKYTDEMNAIIRPYTEGDQRSCAALRDKINNYESNKMNIIMDELFKEMEDYESHLVKQLIDIIPPAWLKNPLPVLDDEGLDDIPTVGSIELRDELSEEKKPKEKVSKKEKTKDIAEYIDFYARAVYRNEPWLQPIAPSIDCRLALLKYHVLHDFLTTWRDIDNSPIKMKAIIGFFEQQRDLLSQVPDADGKAFLKSTDHMLMMMLSQPVTKTISQHGIFAVNTGRENQDAAQAAPCAQDDSAPKKK